MFNLKTKSVEELHRMLAALSTARTLSPWEKGLRSRIVTTLTKRKGN